MIDPANVRTVDDVITIYLDRLDHGEVPDPAEFIQQWPEHATVFMEFISQLRSLEGLVQQQAKGSSVESTQNETLLPALHSPRSSHTTFPKGYCVGLLLAACPDTRFPLDII
ncbi:MAG: hypothetical protein WAO83_15245, partial [Fuerstiella sp.]